METTRRSTRHRATAAATRPDRKQDILLAAERLFAQRGYHAVSLRQIADEAGVPLALVGYYYGPKQDLFHAIFDHWRHTIDERLIWLQRTLAGPGDGDRLTQVITLNENATQAGIQAVLRGIKFSTKGAGFKGATRKLDVTLSVPGGSTEKVSQTINVVKKVPKAPRSRN